VYEGFGRILGPSIFSPTAGTISVEFENGDENEMLVPKNVIVATGSKPRSLPGLEIDGQFVMSSDEALEMETLPESMVIIGGGVIGIEWASLLNDFGVKVTVIEYAKQILPTEDIAIAREMERLLNKKGVTFVKNAKVNGESVEKNDQVSIQAEV